MSEAHEQSRERCPSREDDTGFRCLLEHRHTPPCVTSFTTPPHTADRITVLRWTPRGRVPPIED